MKTKLFAKLCLVALATGAFFGVGLPAKADQLVWVRAQQLDYFKVRGLVPPGSYSSKNNQKPATIGVIKSGTGVGEKKQTTSKFGQQNRSSQPTYNNAQTESSALLSKHEVLPLKSFALRHRRAKPVCWVLPRSSRTFVVL